MAARKQIWTVRVITPKVRIGRQQSLVECLNTPLDGCWIEQFRYMGLLRILAQNDERYVLEFEYPGNSHGIDTNIWAAQNAERMRSFGLNAAPAPKWDGYAPIKID